LSKLPIDPLLRRRGEPDVEGVFDTSRKTPHWGKRKLKTTNEKVSV
jgi:hypothetical protein